MTRNLILVLGDQLSHSLPSLQSLNKENDTVMLCEVMEEATYVQHHPKKIAFIFSAMRHFAVELEAKGVRVRYIKLDDPFNTGNFTDEVKRAVNELFSLRVIVTEPGAVSLYTSDAADDM
jgi:deoxyribodipyrimidine photolyase-related protein